MMHHYCEVCDLDWTAVPSEVKRLQDETTRLAAEIRELRELREAVEEYLPFMPKSTAEDGGASRHSGMVLSSDRLKAALKKVSRG